MLFITKIVYSVFFYVEFFCIKWMDLLSLYSVNIFFPRNEILEQKRILHEIQFWLTCWFFHLFFFKMLVGFFFHLKNGIPRVRNPDPESGQVFQLMLRNSKVTKTVWTCWYKYFNYCCFSLICLILSIQTNVIVFRVKARNTFVGIKL